MLLERVKPPIWRRIEVPASISLAELHLVIQGAMRWTNSHLHEFEIKRRIYGEIDGDAPEELLEAADFTLAEVAEAGGGLATATTRQPSTWTRSTRNWPGSRSPRADGQAINGPDLKAGERWSRLVAGPIDGLVIRDLPLHRWRLPFRASGLSRALTRAAADLPDWQTWSLELPGGVTMEFRILGTLEIVTDGAATPVRAPQLRNLLATLLMRPRQLVSIDELVERLWEDEDYPSNPSGTIHTYVRRLRAIVGPEILQTRDRGYLLDAERLGVCDAHLLLASCYDALNQPTKAATHLTAGQTILTETGYVPPKLP